uniref:Ig-like domain-containing protein n=1 Tax=Strix occidentalis caurina TaxID=311401 RepID=A0A8D0EY30_STROC
IAWFLLFSFLDGFKPLSVTKSKGSVRLECDFKDVSEYDDGTIIHWYQQKENEAPVRILYLAQSKVVDDGFQEYRYMVEKDPHKKMCILTINDVIPDDSATYYCILLSIIRLWDADVKIFGSGTKLIVSSKYKMQNLTPSEISEILQKRHENQIMYVCLIEKFYPEVIRVTWADEADKEVTDNIVKGDVWKPTNGDKYSIGSWLTVPAENKDKNYYCKYEHESQQRSLSTQGIYYMLKIQFYMLL